jgi:hypothetical protein
LCILILHFEIPVVHKPQANRRESKGKERDSKETRENKGKERDSQETRESTAKERVSQPRETKGTDFSKPLGAWPFVKRDCLLKADTVTNKR